AGQARRSLAPRMCRNRPRSKAADDIARDSARRFRDSNRSLLPSARAETIPLQQLPDKRSAFPKAKRATSHHRRRNRQKARSVLADPAQQIFARQPNPFAEARMGHSKS